MRTVISAVDLPDLPRGTARRVEDTVRIQGLAKRGLVAYQDQPAPSRPQPAPDVPAKGPQTISEVIAWVSGDAMRARTARAAERISERPRVTLLRQLERIIEDG
jgi:hypothetical protein